MARQFLNKSVRKARQLFPYPRIWAAIRGRRIPRKSITGSRAGLIRPEAIAFTPSGDLMAVANFGGDSLNIHRRINGAKPIYQSKPSCVITDSDCLKYVHDVAFSPCGKMLVAAARQDQSISVFVRSEDRPDVFELKPSWVIRGEESGLGFPAGVAFHPTGKFLAVANRQSGSSIALYRRHGLSGDREFDSTPFQSITEQELLKHGLAAPHGLDFSPDGKSLIVTHKRFLKTERPEGESGVSIFPCKAKPDIGLDSAPSCTMRIGGSCVHSVAFHPSGEFFAITKERLGVEVFKWRPTTKSISQIESIRIFRAGHGQGAKGLAFTSDGAQLAVTTTLDEVLFFSKWGQ